MKKITIIEKKSNPVMRINEAAVVTIIRRRAKKSWWKKLLRYLYEL